MFYSATENCYFDPTNPSIPPDVVEIEWDVYESLLAGEHAGKVLTHDANGFPILVDKPAPTHAELVAQAERQRDSLVVQANEYMNSRQWPGKAAMGRLSAADKVQYNLWLDYLDALDAVDTSTAPDITWPEKPE